MENKARDILYRDCDTYIYMGEINRSGYLRLSNLIDEVSSNTAKLILSTGGGDPNAAYRIARGLRDRYEYLELIVPDYCKSAGTLVAIGADQLNIFDTGELGPLDMQLNKPDELFEMASGLNIQQALSFIHEQAQQEFSRVVFDLKVRSGLSTKIAVEVATQMATGLYGPIMAQIDPYRVGETQRAINIAYDYGERLNKKIANLKTGALATLITEYQSHGFVIDRKEASELFERVKAPSQVDRTIVDKLMLNGDDSTDRVPLIVKLNNLVVNIEKEIEEEEGNNDEMLREPNAPENINDGEEQ